MCQGDVGKETDKDSFLAYSFVGKRDSVTSKMMIAGTMYTQLMGCAGSAFKWKVVIRQGQGHASWPQSCTNRSKSGHTWPEHSVLHKKLHGGLRPVSLAPREV
jgi:hypothetical protein